MRGCQAGPRAQAAGKVIGIFWGAVHLGVVIPSLHEHFGCDAFRPLRRRCDRSFGPICMHACDCKHPTPVRGWPVRERWHADAAEPHTVVFPWVQCEHVFMCSCGVI